MDQFSNMTGYLGSFSRICVGSLWNHTVITKGFECDHISMLKGSQQHLDTTTIG